MGTRTTHCCIDISGYLRQTDRQLAGLVGDNQGHRYTGAEVRQWLLAQQAEGKRVLPFGEPCEGFSYQTGCPGHPPTVSVSSTEPEQQAGGPPAATLPTPAIEAVYLKLLPLVSDPAQKQQAVQVAGEIVALCQAGGPAAGPPAGAPVLHEPPELSARYDECDCLRSLGHTCHLRDAPRGPCKQQTPGDVQVLRQQLAAEIAARTVEQGETERQWQLAGEERRKLAAMTHRASQLAAALSLCWEHIKSPTPDSGRSVAAVPIDALLDEFRQMEAAQTSGGATPAPPAKGGGA